MGREIKFRVWDKEMKRMHVCGEDVHDSISFDMDNKAFYYNLQNGCGGGTEDDPDSEYILMQYTGLKDKNGKEIYEGDVWAEGDSIGVIVYVQDGFEIEWKHNPEYWSETLKYHHENGSVQGSIFEHPHLLKEESPSTATGAKPLR